MSSESKSCAIHMESTSPADLKIGGKDENDGLGTPSTIIEDETNKRLLRKIDMRLMPAMCFTYALQYYDKALLSQAAIFGLRDDWTFKAA
ncbi:hypothetical protein BDV36DRAFT_294657 [Aspergillus pseudocaelatus]|uniref:Major facilitator superfamily domain-containing protein n=1 Tax=Aspergillus pseudocaelatus TaxID=1825620 RepID=A0ABQ6WPJ6_9EURO|nr:hypothetical protein BDV36DRAFT_294657 [Aspergillus pseudocaelatus]